MENDESIANLLTAKRSNMGSLFWTLSKNDLAEGPLPTITMLLFLILKLCRDIGLLFIVIFTKDNKVSMIRLIITGQNP